ncbi:MAG: DUF1566 domain-containing protein [Arcobacter sp.]|nr:DUF1566 domain-containing protein [Arcobacter sp.]
MRVLFLIVLFLSFLDARIYRQNSRQVVVDTKNKLMWIDDESVFKIMKNHEEALKYCEDLKFSSYLDWRLPNIEEYKTIVDKKNEKNYINKAFKFNIPSGYWAFKAHWRTLWFYADYMHFISGTAYFDSRHKKKYVRCVRTIK